MKTVGYVLIGLLLFAGIAAWVRLHAPGQSGVAAVGALAPRTSFSVGSHATTSPPITLQGTYVLDYSYGLPPAPYLMFYDSEQRLRSRQLVYYGSRACNPNAGDYPCVSPYTAEHGYPYLADGSHIRVEGYPYEDRFLVLSLAPID